MLVRFLPSVEADLEPHWFVANLGIDSLELDRAATSGIRDSESGKGLSDCPGGWRNISVSLDDIRDVLLPPLGDVDQFGSGLLWWHIQPPVSRLVKREILLVHLPRYRSPLIYQALIPTLNDQNDGYGDDNRTSKE